MLKFSFTKNCIARDAFVASKSSREPPTSLISELKPLIQEIGDATLIVPLIKEYLEIGVKNDEHIIKLTAIVQRMMNNTAGGGSDSLLSDEELKQLQSIAEDIAKGEDGK